MTVGPRPTCAKAWHGLVLQLVEEADGLVLLVEETVGHVCSRVNNHRWGEHRCWCGAEAQEHVAS